MTLNFIFSTSLPLNIFWTTLASFIVINIIDRLIFIRHSSEPSAIPKRNQDTNDIDSCCQVALSSTDLIIPLTLISALLHKPHNVLLGASCVATCRFISTACDASMKIYEQSGNETAAQQLTGDNDACLARTIGAHKTGARVTMIVRPAPTTATAPLTAPMTTGTAKGLSRENVYLKILLHVCIGKVLYFYQVSEEFGVLMCVFECAGVKTNKG